MGTLGLGNGSLRMDDVYLEGSTPDGPAMVGHLSVIVDTEGITFLGPEPGERRIVGWDRSSPLEFGRPAALPGGQPVTSLEFAVDGRPLRILVPSRDGSVGSLGSDGLVEELSLDTLAVDEVEVEELAVDEVEVEELAVDEVEVEELAVDEVEVEELAVDEVEVEELAVDEVVVDEVVLDDVPAEPPVPVAVVGPPVPVAVVEPPVPVAVVEPPVPVALAPAPDDPPAPVMAEPPAPVMAQPPAPLILDPPPAPAGVVDDTFAVTGTPADEWDTDGDGASTRLPAWYRYSPRRPKGIRTSSLTRGQRIVRLALFTVLAGLIPIAVGARYFQTHGNAGHISGVPLSDAAIAGRVGIQPSDLPGWSASAPTEGNVFAAGATTQGAAAASTAALASTVMARCLHVPVSAVDGAFGMGTAGAQISAQASSPTYADPAGNGGAVSSVVDVVKTTQVQEADAAVFGNPALFATCYQPFVQAMLPYAGGGAAFATATVQPLVVPVPAGPATETVAAFQIARIANVDGQPKTVIATVTAVFDGRVQATLGTVSDLVFSIDAQNDLVRDLEARTIGVGEL